MGLNGTERYGALDLAPAKQRVQTMQSLTHLLVNYAKDKPVLLVYEDLHWIDPTSLELLESQLDAIADQPIMILATARPVFEHGFGAHSAVKRIALNRLGRKQINEIVSKLTGGKTLPDEVMDIISSRTDGVPLFVEELTKTIVESDVLKADGNRLLLNGPLSSIAIPTTLHDSLMARLDRLQPIKEGAQTAACIGREFSHALIAQISRLAEPELNVGIGGPDGRRTYLSTAVAGEDRVALNRSLAMQTKIAFESMARNGWGNDNTKAELEQALKFADKVGETPLRFAILYGLMTTRYMRGDHMEAVKHGQTICGCSRQGIRERTSSCSEPLFRD